MVQYLNANQGFVMAVLTAVYVIATIVLVLVAQRQASLTRAALELSAHAETAKYRPYVVFDIVYEKAIAYARLRNSGVSSAIDVRITIAPQPKWDDKPGVGFIERGVAFLSPSRELSEPFSWSEDFFRRFPDLKFAGNISYRDAELRSYDEEFSIDLGYLKGMTSIGEIDIGRQLEGIRKTLERFHDGSFRPLVRTIADGEFRERQEADFAAGQRYLRELEMAKSQPNKAPEPTPGSVTPRATEGVSK